MKRKKENKKGKEDVKNTRSLVSCFECVSYLFCVIVDKIFEVILSIITPSIHHQTTSHQLPHFL